MMKWTFEKLCGNSTILSFEGSELEAEQFFYDNCICALCKEEVNYHALMDPDGIWDTALTPMMTACGSEWSIEKKE